MMKVYFVTFIFSFFTFISCKKNTNLEKQVDAAVLNQKVDLDKTQNLKSLFSYKDLIGKNFFEVSEINNEYYFVYVDFTFDMNHRVFQFEETEIKHLDPVEWINYNVLKTEILSDKLKIEISYPNGIKRDLYFKYNKDSHTLRYSKNPDFSEVIVLFDKSKKDLVKYKSIGQPKLSFNRNFNINKVQGNWSVSCKNLREYYSTFKLDTEQGGVFLMPFDQEDFFIPCSYKISKNNLVLKLHPEATKTRLVDFNLYSKDSIIGHFGFDDKNRGKLYWYGIYNKEKKKRDYHIIIFNEEENEEGIKSPILLEKCD